MNDYAIGNGIKNSKYWQPGEFDFQVQIGSVKYPQSPITSHGEGYYQLKKCLGLQSSSVHSFDISLMEYRHSKFILGIDTERQLGSGFTGINTRAGDVISIRFTHRDTDVTKYATQVYTTLHSDNVLEIRDSGISVFD